MTFQAGKVFFVCGHGVELPEKFAFNLKERQLVRPGDKVVVAVSGGGDSVVLLDLFAGVCERLYLKLAVAHLNHGLRGEDADGDEAFVQQLADRYSVKYFGKKVDTRQFAAETKVSMEVAARILRYQFFEEVMAEFSADKLATGHHANDQAETILDRLLRGAGVSGLAGIPIIRGKYIRPLLNTKRSEILAYAEARGLTFRTDATNYEWQIRRNRIRHELIPYLQRQFNPNVVEVLRRTGEILAENEAYLEAQAEKAFQETVKKLDKRKIVLDIGRFLRYFITVRKYAIFRALENLGIDRHGVDFRQMERILHLAEKGQSGAKVCLPNGGEVLVSGTELVFRKCLDEGFNLEVEIGKVYTLPNGRVFSSRLVDGQDVTGELGQDVNVEFVDYDKLQLPLTLRMPKPGDRFVPFNMPGSKKLSDFFIDKKVPNYQRNEVPILTDARGIVWVGGFRIDDRYKITPESRRVVRLELKEEKG